LEVPVLFPVGIIAMKYTNTAKIKGQALVSGSKIKSKKRELSKPTMTSLATPGNHVHW
jgi:hypothetical protein